MSSKTSSEPQKSSRLAVLDHLRGFFIVVIIVDHLSRWPSLLSAITGKAWLWVTAAEGFVAISGLLVGYVRGYKNKDQPLWTVSKKLLSRAFLLYIWAIIGTFVYTAILWYIPLQGGAPGLRIETGNWGQVALEAVTLQYTFVWVFFLSIYALFLAASPIAIWLLRKNLPWLVALISFGVMAIGWATAIEVLQWQFLFFMPMIAGYYLSSIMKWWASLKLKTQRLVAGGTMALTALTIALSVAVTMYGVSLFGLNAQLSEWFSKDSISLLRAGMAFLWFIGFIFIFKAGHVFISKFFGWLLLPIGTRSLTAYILHGLAIVFISFTTMSGDNVFINTGLGIVAVLLTWAILKIPNINKVIPS